MLRFLQLALDFHLLVIHAVGRSGCWTSRHQKNGGGSHAAGKCSQLAEVGPLLALACALPFGLILVYPQPLDMAADRCIFPGWVPGAAGPVFRETKKECGIEARVLVKTAEKMLVSTGRESLRKGVFSGECSASDRAGKTKPANRREAR